MNKIVLRVSGGIGNQLFSYAAARRLSIVNNMELVLDDVSGFMYDYTYKRQYQLDNFNIPCAKASPSERLEPFSLVRRYIKRRWNAFFNFENRGFIVQKGVSFDPRLLTLAPEKGVFLEGYWQSEKYFIDIEDIIRNDLRIKKPSDCANLLLASHIEKCNSVAVHFRFFDSPEKCKGNNMSNDYYLRAIKKMDNLIKDPHYFIFSDNPELAREKLLLPASKVTFVENNQGEDNSYTDIWLMSLCENFIIANSTFSWWGAWLSENKSKNVISPLIEIAGKENVTSWGFEGLLPDDWIKL